MQRFFFFVLASVFTLLSACSFFGFGSHEPAPNPDPNHTHADFAVWIEGKKLDFADSKYMSGLSSDKETHDEEGEHRHPYFHLHDGIGHVIHRHKPGLPIREFFSSLGIELSEACFSILGSEEDDHGDIWCNDGIKKLRMFVNDIEIPWNPDYVFADTDQILITTAVEDAEIERQLQAMTNDACLYSRTCPWRGDPPVENCIADPEVPCVLPVE